MPSRKSGLGRGLEALIPKAERTFSIGSIERVHPNPRQPRERFDEEALASLAASIREVGLLQPVIVNEDDEGWPANGGCGPHGWSDSLRSRSSSGKEKTTNS